MGSGNSKNAPLTFMEPSAERLNRKRESRELAQKLANAIIQRDENETKALLENLNTLTEWDINGLFTIDIFKPRELVSTGFGPAYVFDPEPDKILERRRPLLCLATQYSSLKTCERLLEHPNACPHASDGEKNTPMHIAVTLGRKDIVSYLATYPGIDLQIKNDNGQTPMDLASDLAKTGDPDRIEILNCLNDLTKSDQIRLG